MHGLLFSTDFLLEGIRATRGWANSEQAFLAFRDAIGSIYGKLHGNSVLNEAQTEEDIIEPVLDALGWKHRSSQVNASRKGREDVPDFLLFASPEAKQSALANRKDDRRYRHGLLILEAKRWARALDRGDATDALDISTPSNQMLRYLSRVEVASDRAIQWGMLTNGGLWRLYWQNARSRAEEFVQFDLADLAGVAGVNADMFASADATASVHLLRAFFLLFRRDAFLPQPGDAEGRSFHALALDEGRLWESKVSQDLGQRVFDDLFPRLTVALAKNDPQAVHPYSRDYLEQIHRAALILLYRLLFVLYAEDRDLLPVRDKRYADYSLRSLRDDIARRSDHNHAFSTSATRAWQHLRSLFRAIDKGDDSLGLPPYNGGLFDASNEPLLARIELPDAELAPLIDGLSRRPDLSGRAFINYRDLAVQHLGSIYERLLEQRLIETTGGGIAIQPSPFARKNSGSYYTHDDLVKLILRETLDPLANERIATFDAAVRDASKRRKKFEPAQLHSMLAAHDPARALLDLKVCDPAMGSGHFLVSLVDDLADRVLEQLAGATATAAEAGIAGYLSPVTQEITILRERILARAAHGRWAIDPALLDDRHLVRRMILKRVVHGVDKNPMAVELAKLALWLHTFTVGAPLSFLDHHLRCGDSLYGERLATVRMDLNRLGALFNDSHTAGMLLAAQTMHQIGALNDIDLSEVERSRKLTDDAFASLDNLRRIFDLWQALRWIAPLNTPRAKRKDIHATASELLSGRYSMTLGEMLTGAGRVHSDNEAVDRRVNALLDACRALAQRENFLHWELAFPGVWPSAGSGGAGGFDAVIGNPPWDRMKLQEVEWFAERRPAIAKKARASDRKQAIATLRTDGDALVADYDLAAQRAEDSARIARDCGEYPLLSSGDINLYSLFVERASQLVKPDGVVGLLTPSGIAADKGAAKFFRSIATTGRLAALFDFENRKKMFPDVDSRFKFCALIFAGTQRRFEQARCAFYLHTVAELAAPVFPDAADDARRLRATRVIALSADDFRAVNPNTGTAPIFRNALDAQLTTRIYRAHPVLVRHVFAEVTDPITKVKSLDPDTIASEQRLYPVRYMRMFDMTNDSGLFKRRDELEAEGWYPVAGGHWKKGDAEMLPLYVGRMIQHYDHRASNVVVNAENLHNAALSSGVSDAQKRDPNFVPTPQYWVPAGAEQLADYSGWAIGFRDIARSTDARTFIASIVPHTAAGNTLPLVLADKASSGTSEWRAFFLANVSSLVLDYFARQKVQTTHLNWYIVEQLPLIAPNTYAQPLGNTTIGDFVRGEVLRLSYTAHDLAPFARDLGYDGAPFAWDAEDRRHRTARLDALYFNLYGLTRDEAAYVLDTFPIVREHDEAQFNRYRTKDLVLGYMNALAAGDTTTVISL